MEKIKPIIRVVAPVFLAFVLLIAGSAVVLARASENGESMSWIWAPALIMFLAALVLIRKRISAWVSPTVFLFACVPVLVLLVTLNLFFPSPPAAAAAERGERVDLSGTFVDAQGKEVTLKDYSGKILFVNFWATWCGPCRSEMPSMANLYNKLQEEGLAMVAITDEDLETVQDYLEESPYPFPILSDADGLLFDRFRVRGLPTTLVVDANHQLLFQHVGADTWDSSKMVEKFRKLLSE